MSVNPEVLRVLKEASLLRNFTDTGLQILASIAHEKHIPAKAPLFVEGMIGDGLYIVAEGQLRLAMRGKDGQEATLVTLGPGDSLGEAAVLREGPRLCSAYAETPVRVLEISRRDLATLQRTKPQACLKLMMGVAQRLGERMLEAQEDLRELLG